MPPSPKAEFGEARRTEDQVFHPLSDLPRDFEHLLGRGTDIELHAYDIFVIKELLVQTTAKVFFYDQNLLIFPFGHYN